MTKQYVLAGDIGGTNSRLLLVESDLQTGAASITEQETYASQSYASFDGVLNDFIDAHNIKQITTACFAVAGPIIDNTAKLTNLPWHIKAEEIEQSFSINKVLCVNDFYAVAYSLEYLLVEDLITLQSAKPQAGYTRVIIGAGTGLGQAIITSDNNQNIIITSEGGHVTFAPNDKEEILLLEYWQEKLGRVTIEHFVSGPGIERIYEFYQVTESGTQYSQKTDDMAAYISEQAVIYRDPLAIKTLKTFVKLYASHAGDLALTANARGGVFIAGGIAPKLIEFIQSDEFIHAFNDKPPMKHLLSSIPVHLITNSRAGQIGAIEIALSLLD